MLPKGKYYIGDLCYVLTPDEWDEYCTDFPNGEFTINGKRMALYNTAHGDGRYDANVGGECPVDSGTIGCILVSDIDKSMQKKANKLGIIVDFENSFHTSEMNGCISFGHVSIETASDYDDDQGDDWNSWQGEDDTDYD